MDRCNCWGTTKIVITIEHCPSASIEIAKELDRVINFTMKETELKRFGKATMGVASFTQAGEVQ